MHRLIDDVLATKADRAKAQHWSSYALRQYGPDAAERLKLGLAPGAGVNDRRALRIAIRQAEGRAKQQICIAVLPGGGLVTPSRHGTGMDGRKDAPVFRGDYDGRRIRAALSE